MGAKRAWLFGAAIALALLVVPIVALLWFPAVNHSSAVGGPASAAVRSGDPSAEAGDTLVASERAIRGVVVDGGGASVVGARVTLTDAQGAELRSTTTRADGRFTLRGPAGDLSIAASSNTATSAANPLPHDGDVTDVEIVLRAKAALSGQVVDGDGKGVEDSYVVCEHDASLSATTDAKGRFTMDAAADGCTATATHIAHGTSPAIALRSGAKNRLVLPSPGEIRGTVVDDKGAAITSFTIGIESFVSASGDRDAPVSFRVRRFEDPAGQFTLENLEPGRYVLSASTEGRPPAKSKAIDLVSGERARSVQITVGLGGTLSGTVTDRETNAPIEGVRVRLDAAMIGGSSTSDTTDAEGRYTLTGIPNAPFSARFWGAGYKERIVSLDASTSSSLTQDVDLSKKGDDGAEMEMTGIGATLGQGNKFVEVTSVLAGGPAEAAGMQEGDRIERIDNKSAASFTVSDCVNKLRGPEGTRVSVTLGRGTTTLELTITRARIERARP